MLLPAIGNHDAFAALLEYLGRQMQLGFMLFAHADIANGAGHKPAADNFAPCQQELKRKLAHIFAQACQLDSFTYDARLAAGLSPLHARQMPVPVAFRHQQRQRLTKNLGLRVAEDRCGAPVPAHNMARVIGGDNGIAGRIRHCAIALLASAQLLFCLPACRFTGKVIERKADIGRHFRQQLTRGIIEGMDLAGVQREIADHDTVSVQRQRGRGAPAETRAALVPLRIGRIMLEILTPDRLLLA